MALDPLTDLSAYLAWPGKRGSGSDDLGTGPAWHPAAFHMLDVAAVAVELVACSPGRNKRIAQILGLDPEAARRWLATMVALHDIGKFTVAFAAKILGDEAPDSIRQLNIQQMPHWQASMGLLQALDGLIEPRIGATGPARQMLYSAVAGHHGQPAATAQNSELRNLRKEQGLTAARAFTNDLLSLLDPHPATCDLDSRAASRFSWTLNGLAVMSDWIGSNRSWFPYTSPETISLTDYWELARERAAIAVAKSGASGAAIDANLPAEALLAIPNLRPLQQLAEAVRLPMGPTLVILEDLTGAGKTEAALLLARRMIAADKATGLHIALPTMATANAIFDRLAVLVRRLFSGTPSLALAHSRRALHPGFRAAIRADDAPPTEETAPGCAAWIADDRRKAFLADIGVGTIDQALQAILPSRFNTLRLWGLGDRVLIIDEAHAYDSYMNEELTTLLRFQAALGGSAIVMTATLPTKLRRRLASAYCAGLGQESVRDEGRSPFPGMTVIGRNHHEIHPIEPVSSTRRTVLIRRLGSEAEALERVRQAARSGAAVAWVRNAVDDAIDAARMLEAEGVPVTLFHARFAMGDRLAIERAVTERFGRDSISASRSGHVLIATQVVEQSLDLDFDVMVSDLAPVDLLIQRAGRLWRHMDRRPRDLRPDMAPVLDVLSPDPADLHDDRWLHGTLGRGAWTYSLDRQYLTATAIFAAGRLEAPDGLPSLIEAVYADNAELPEVIRTAADRAEGERRAEAAHGAATVLNLEAGYSGNQRFGDRGDCPTRLADPSRTMVLARRSPSGLIPWAPEPTDDIARRWTMSEVTIRERQYRRIAGDLMPEDALEVRKVTDRWPDWRRLTHRLVLVGDDGSCGGATHYNSRFGFLMGKAL